MKRRRNRFEVEAWVMAIILPGIVVISMVAGFVVPWLARMFGWHPH
jgi:MFS-type transporter involved in bile tolerance (Atg22 family)